MRRLLLLPLLLLALPAFAQETAFTEAEQEWIAYVSEALTNTLALESYTASGVVTMTQQIEPSAEATGAVAITQTMQQTIEGQVINSDEGLSIQTTIAQDILMNMAGQPEMNITQTLDVIVVDGALYMRFSNLSEMLAALFPEGWVNLSETPDAFPGSNIIVADQYTQAIQSGLSLPLSADILLSIRELTDEALTTEDGQPLRVFALEIDVPALFAMEEMNAVLGMFNLQGVGASTPDVLEEFSSRMQMSLVLHIGAEDALVHYQETQVVVTELDASLLTGQTAPIYLSQDVLTAITYGQFNVPASIEAPQVGE